MGIPGINSDIERKSSGRESVALTQKGRVISVGSGLIHSPAAALISRIRGCRSIPHFGQAAGWLSTTSRSIGQQYSTDVGEIAVASNMGSRAIPHFGHAPGVGLCTSGCIGQG